MATVRCSMFFYIINCVFIYVVVVPLPVWDELLNDNLFQTECFQTSEHYNSVINIAGKLYAIHDGGVNQIRINTKRKKVETLNKVCFV